jgi:hypothetical protein
MRFEPKPHIAKALDVLRAATVVLIAIVANIIIYADLVTQRIASTLSISRFAPSQFATPDGVRNFNRIVVATFTMFIIFCTIGYEYEKVVEHVEVPILGAGESPVFGYYPPIGNNFLPKVAPYNVAPKYRPRTPLLIPFTRNHTMMRQTVLSYIAGGWPRSDILIVDNSGTMDANPKGQLTPANPFYLDYELFRRRYGVSLITTPTLLNFAQLQNFMLRVAVGRDWPYYFWSHMDVAVLGGEEFKPYKSFYHRILDVLDASNVDQWVTTEPKKGLIMGGDVGSAAPSADRKGIFTGEFDRSAHPEAKYQAKAKRGLLKPRWGVKFFSYDYLSLVNVEAWRATGQWDVYIPYYNTDCDFYQRMAFAGYRVEEAQAGHIFDVAEAIEDPEERFFPGPSHRSRTRWGMSSEGEEPEDGKINSGRYKWLKAELEEMVQRKTTNKGGRNTWQTGGMEDRKPSRSKDGKPRRQPQEPWTYDPRGFQAAWWAMADAGRVMYVKKWATLDCDLRGAKKSLDDLWLQEYVQEGTEVYNVRAKQEEHYMSKLSERPIR